jgi:hypothetical protein
MSTEEELNYQKDLNEELLKSAAAYSKLKESQQDVLFFTRDYADEAKKAAKEVLGSTIAASETSKAFRDVASAAKKITDNYAGVLLGQKKFSDLQKEGIALEASKASLATEYAQVLTTIGFNQAEINSVINEGVEASAIFDAQGKDMTANQMVLLELFEEQNQQLQDEAANMSEIADRAKTIDDAMRPLGESAISLQDMGEGLSEGLSKAGLGDLSGKLGMEEAISGARETAAGLTEGGTKALNMGGKLDVAGGMAKTMGKNLMKSLGPAALIAMAVEQIVKAFKLIDGASGEVAKNMGVSAKEGRALVSSSADAAAMSGDLLVSTKDVVAAQMSLNKQFGTSVAFSGEFAAEFASISERTGLSSKAMGVFAEKAMLSGTSIKDQLKKVTAVTMEMSAQTGVMLNAKDIQEGIGEMSHAQMLTTGMNTKEMAKQVFQAKMLGVSQSQLASIGDSLLDFESSIAAEMEAELLTGKQLNLEGARAAALKGDQAALAAELRKEVGTAAEFGKMNVIQQQAMAKAFGMSREDMAGMLVEQEKLEKVKAAGFTSASDAQEQYNKALEDGTLTEKLKADLTEAGVLNQMESATAQDKMNAAMEKLTDLFVQLIDPLMPIIDALMAILDPIFAILSPILKLVGDLVQLVVTVLMPAFNAITGIFDNLASSFTSIFGGFGEVVAGIFAFDTEMILGGLKSIINGAIGLVALPFQAITDSIVGALNVIIRGVNLIPGVNFGLIESPDLAGIVALEEGGVVTGPTPSLIGEGSEAEAVLPLSKLANMLPSGLAIGDAVLNAATTPMRGIMNTIGSIFDQGDIGDAIKNPISGLMDTVSGMFSGGSSPVSGLMDTIGGIFDGDSIIDKVSNIATSPLRGIMDTVGSVFGSESLGDILKNPLEGITSPMEGIGKLTDMLPSMGSPMSGISEMMSSAKSGISNFLGTGDDKEINNEEVSLLLKELITTVKEGGDVYLDGTKVGYTLALQSSKMA